MNRTLQDKLPELEAREEFTLLARNYPLTQQILRTDVSGMPLEWVDYREAARIDPADEAAQELSCTLSPRQRGDRGLQRCA